MNLANQQNSKCSKCAHITIDRTPDDLKRRKQCPSCGQWQNYKSIGATVQARKKNKVCQSCVGKNRSPETRKKLARARKKWWTPQRKQAQSERVKLWWSQQDDPIVGVEISKRISKGLRTRKSNFAKMKEEDPDRYWQWRKRLKQSFRKYCGENHWTHRPEVIRKIKQSCEIYQNGGHWFHTNPETLRKMLRTKKKLSVSTK